VLAACSPLANRSSKSSASHSGPSQANWHPKPQNLTVTPFPLNLQPKLHMTIHCVFWSIKQHSSRVSSARQARPAFSAYSCCRSRLWPHIHQDHGRLASSAQEFASTEICLVCPLLDRRTRLATFHQRHIEHSALGGQLLDDVGLHSVFLSNGIQGLTCLWSPKLYHIVQGVFGAFTMHC